MGAADGHLGVDAAGHLVFAAGGHLAFDCGANPCDPDPAVNVTLTWTDADVTKSYMGETFTNGQTHAICPRIYKCGYYQSPYAPKYFSHSWYYGYQAPGVDHLRLGVHYKKYYFTARTEYYNFVRMLPPDVGPFLATYGYVLIATPYASTFTITASLSTHGVNGTQLMFRAPASITNAMFSQVTTNAGITVAWARGAGDWTCP